jgi:hypothetical protein
MDGLTVNEMMYLSQVIWYLKFRCLDDEDKPRELAGS